MPVWYSVPPLWGTCDLIPLAGLLYLDAVSCCFWFSKETRVFSLCGVFWGFGISAKNGVFRKNILFDPTPKDFSLPLQKKKQNQTSPSWAETPNLEVFPAWSLNSDELFRWFLSQKSWDDSGSFLPGASHARRKALPMSLQAQNPSVPFLLFISSTLPDTSTF